MSLSSLALAISCSSVVAAPAAARRSLAACSRYSAISRACASVETTFRTSPASGVPLRPRTSTGTEGPASFTRSPLSLMSARTLPHCSPTTKMSPCLNVPFWTRTVATGPRPTSSCASITAPSAGRSGLAVISRSSACSAIASRSSGMPWPDMAETSTSCTSPDIFSTITSCCRRSVRTLSGVASGLSILLIATIIGTSAALAWLMASIVGGVAGGIEEAQHRAAIGRHLVGADMLRDAAGLARDHIRLPDPVQKRGLAVVDMAHDGDDGRTRPQILVLVLDGVDHVLHVGGRDTLNAVAEFLDDEFRGVGVDRLVLRDHHAVVHQRLHHIGDTFGHAVGQFRHDDGFGHLNVADDLFTVLRAASGLLPRAFLLALHGGKAALTPAFATGQSLIHGKLARAALAAPVATAPTAATIVFFLAPNGCRGRATGAAHGLVRGGCLGGNGFRCGGRVAARLLVGLAPRVFLFLGLERFFALALFAFLGLGLGAAAGAFLFTLALFLGAAFLILGLAGLGGLQRLQTTLEFRVGECLVTLATLGVLRRCRLSARLGHDHALALRFHDDAFGAPARKALVHAAGPRTTREAKGFFSVLIAHATPSSFPADPPPSALRRPCSFAAPSTTRGERPPAASAPCITL